jgi:hypothetical protein
VPLGLPEDLADLEPQRVCPACNRVAVVVRDCVTCPRCGPILRWAVALGGRLLYPAPRRRAARARHVTA